MSKVYLDGMFVDEDAAAVSVGDRGFLYGDGLFETMRAYGGRVFRLGDHVGRLMQSAKVLRIPVRESGHDLESAVAELLDMNGLGEAYVRITLTRGAHRGDLGLDTGEPPTLLIAAREYHGYPQALYERGMKLAIASAVRHSASPVGRHKTLNYLENLVARDAAKSAGFDETLFLDENGCVTECSTSNVFWVRGDHLRTPSAEMNLLPGITRAVVMEIARWGGRKVLDRRWPLDEFDSADEVFLTNSLMEIMPVTRIDDLRIGDGRPGAVTREIADAYRRTVEEECGLSG